MTIPLQFLDLLQSVTFCEYHDAGEVGAECLSIEI